MTITVDVKGQHQASIRRKFQLVQPIEDAYWNEATRDVEVQLCLTSTIDPALEILLDVIGTSKPVENVAYYRKSREHQHASPQQLRSR